MRCSERPLRRPFERRGSLGAHRALHPRTGFETVQVGQRFTEGEHDLVVVEMAREQHRHHVPAGRTLGAALGDRRRHVVEARVVVGHQLVEAGVQADEGKAVARQDQRVGTSHGADASEDSSIAQAEAMVLPGGSETMVTVEKKERRALEKAANLARNARVIDRPDSVRTLFNSLKTEEGAAVTAVERE